MSTLSAVAPPAAASRRRSLYLSVALFLCAFAMGSWDFRNRGYGFGRGYEMAATARNLVKYGAFANPFEPWITGPTAANPPAYPLLLAGLTEAFGPRGYVLVAAMLNILLNAAIALALPSVSAIFYRDRLPGVFAGFLWVPSMRLLPQWDATLTVAALLAFVILTSRSRSSVSAGLLGGLLTLLNPATGLIFGPWLVYLILVHRRSGRYAAVVFAIVAACNVPWLVRNYLVFHAPVLRTNFGYTIYSSNNDCAEASLTASLVRCFAKTHPSASAAEAKLLASMGELEYDRLRYRDTIAWIRSHPIRFCGLTLRRVVQFWFPERLVPHSTYGIWLVTVLSIPGLFFMLRHRNPLAVYILATWLLYPLMFYIVVTCERYRYPLLWTSLLPAGYAVARLFRRATSGTVE